MGFHKKKPSWIFFLFFTYKCPNVYHQPVVAEHSSTIMKKLLNSWQCISNTISQPVLYVQLHLFKFNDQVFRKLEGASACAVVNCIITFFFFHQNFFHVLGPVLHFHIEKIPKSRFLVYRLFLTDRTVSFSNS